MNEQNQELQFNYHFVENDDNVEVFLVNDFTSRYTQINKSRNKENAYLVVISYGNLSENGRPGICKLPMIYTLDNGGATAHANNELQSKISKGYTFNKVIVNKQILYPPQQ